MAELRCRILGVQWKFAYWTALWVLLAETLGPKWPLETTFLGKTVVFERNCQELIKTGCSATNRSGELVQLQMVRNERKNFEKWNRNWYSSKTQKLTINCKYCWEQENAADFLYSCKKNVSFRAKALKTERKPKNTLWRPFLLILEWNRYRI